MSKASLPLHKPAQLFILGWLAFLFGIPLGYVQAQPIASTPSVVNAGGNESSAGTVVLVGNIGETAVGDVCLPGCPDGTNAHLGFLNMIVDPDGTPPTVVQTPPPANGDIIGTPGVPVTLVAISGTASDASGIANVRIVIDSSTYATIPGTAAFFTYTYSWDLQQELDGRHNIRVIATDNSGLSAQTAEITVVINNRDFADPLNPGISGIRATPNIFNPTLGQATTIAFQLSEEVRSATVTVAGQMLLAGATLPAGVHAIFWNGGGATDGTYPITVTATTYAGEIFTNSSVGMNSPQIDSTRPGIISISAATIIGNDLFAVPTDTLTVSYVSARPGVGTTLQRLRQIIDGFGVIQTGSDAGFVLESTGSQVWNWVSTGIPPSGQGVYRYSVRVRTPPPMPLASVPYGSAFVVLEPGMTPTPDVSLPQTPTVTVYHPGGTVNIQRLLPGTPAAINATKAIVASNVLIKQSALFDITTTAPQPFTPPAIIEFRYDPALFGGSANVQTLQLRRWDGTNWVLAGIDAQYVDEPNNRVFAQVSSLSLFALFTLRDSAAPVVSNLSGDSFSPDGDGKKDTTFLRYILSENGPGAATIINIFTSGGSLIRSLLFEELRPAGQLAEPWDGKDDSGVFVSSGTYTFKIKARDASGNESAEQSGTVVADLTGPQSITTLAASPGDLTGEVRLKWTAVGDDTSNTNALYFIKVATHAIAEANFNAATVQSIAPPPPAPASAGTIQTTVVTGLSPNTEYFFAMKVEDNAGNQSSVSNSPSALARGVGSPIRMNEIAPSEPGGNDKIEIFVATSATYSGYRLYEVANAVGSEQVKVFPTTGAWASPLPAGTFIVINFNSASADETTITNNVINLYTTDTGLRATDNVLMLSDSSGISFSDGIYQSGAIVDFVTWANQDDVNYVNQQSQMLAAINAAVSVGEWTKLGSTPIQLDAVNSRGLDGTGKAIARNEASSDAGLPAKHDWSYRTTLSIGSANGASTTISGDGSAFLSPGGSVTAGLTNTNWTITYTNSSSANDNIGHMVSIDIPSGWSAPQTSNPSGVGFTTTTFSFTQDYEITISQNKIILPVGNLANGESISVQYKNATVQSSPGTAQFLVSSDQTGTNVGALLSGSPSVAVSGDTIAPSSITTLAAQTGQNTGEVSLSWISPGDDGTIGTAMLYIVRYASGAQITESDFAQATDVPNEPAPLVSGTAQSMLVTGLAPNVTYFFALKTQDEAANTSSISNSPSSEAKPETLIATHVVISEVSPGTTQASFEYVELYNPTTAAILLQGNVKLKMTTGTGDALQTKTLTWVNSTIPSHGFFLFASTSPISGVSADATFSSGLTGNDGVMLTNNSDVSIDRVAWGNGGAGDIPTATENTRISSATNLSTGDSIERKAKNNSTSSSMLPGGQDNLRGNGFDSDNNQNDFVIHIGTFFPQNSGSIEGSPAFTASLEPTEITLTPPHHDTMDLVIANLDSEDDFFDLDIKTAMATTWWTLPPNLMVKAGSTERKSIQITIPANVTFPEDTLFPIEVQVKHQCSPSHAQRHEPSSDFRVAVYGEVLVRSGTSPSARLRIKKNVSRSGGGALHRAGAQITFSTSSLAQDTLIEIIQEDTSNPTEETRKFQSQSQLGLKSVGLGFEFYPEGLTFNGSTEITLLYEDANLSGPHDFLAYYWNPKLITWEEEFTLFSDTETKQVSARINHFSLYRVFAKPHKTTSAPPQNAAPVYTDFSQSKCFPTPIQMGSGTQFDASYITMDKLPVGTIAEVYTINGEKICSLGPSEGSELRWDCKNAEGNHVGPGIYLCPLLAPNGQKKTDVMVVE